MTSDIRGRRRDNRIADAGDIVLYDPTHLQYWTTSGLQYHNHVKGVMHITSVLLTSLSLASVALAQCDRLPQIDNSTYQGSILGHVNIHRFNHSASELSWNTTLAGWAQQQAEACVYRQSREFGDGNYGQNLGAGYSTSQMGGFITDACYNDEQPKYPFGTEPDQSTLRDWGHFSQLVWKASDSVGCATVDCSTRGGLQNVPAPSPGAVMSQDYTVCNFFPVGNVIDNYVANVGSPLNYPSIDGNY